MGCLESTMSATTSRIESTWIESSWSRDCIRFSEDEYFSEQRRTPRGIDAGDRVPRTSAQLPAESGWRGLGFRVGWISVSLPIASLTEAYPHVTRGQPGLSSPTRLPTLAWVPDASHFETYGGADRAWRLQKFTSAHRIWIGSLSGIRDRELFSTFTSSTHPSPTDLFAERLPANLQSKW